MISISNRSAIANPERKDYDFVPHDNSMSHFFDNDVFQVLSLEQI